MIGILFRRLLIIPAAIVEIVPALCGKNLGLADWCFDRRVGDPTGKLLQTRDEAKAAATQRGEPKGR